VASVEIRQIEVMIEQLVQCVFERAGQKLLRQIDGKKSRTGVDVLVASPVVSLIRRSSSFDLDAHNRSA